MPKALHLEPLANDPRRVAIMWGPAGDRRAISVPEPDRGAGRGGQAPIDVDIPVIVAAEPEARRTG